MWCLRYISRCFFDDGCGGWRTRSSGYRVFSIAAWAMGASSAFHLEENLWDYTIKKKKIDGLNIHEHGTNVYNDHKEGKLKVFNKN
jgi:hypothetical protein